MPVSKKRSSSKSGKRSPGAAIHKYAMAKAQRQLAHDVKRNTLPFSHPFNAFAMDQVFGPVEAIVYGIAETGEVHTHQGDPVFFHEQEGVWFPIAPTLRDMCTTFEIAAANLGVEPKIEGVQQLIKKLHYGMPLEKKDTDAALESLRWMREFTLPLTPAQMSSFLRSTQIKAELAARQLTTH
jgi:hypothetical protein